MDEKLLRRLREQNLAFFAMISAGMSHEMRNVLSIIGEYAGLLDDFLVAAERGAPLDSDKLKRLSAKMTRQVKKGTEAMERFSYFAHGADELTASVDLNALVRNVTDLAQRRAFLLGCKLECDTPKKPVKTVTNPFSLQHAIFSSIQLMLGAMGKDQTVSVQLVRKGAEATISVLGGATVDGGLSDHTSEISALMAELDGGVEASMENGKTVLTLTLPK